MFWNPILPFLDVDVDVIQFVVVLSREKNTTKLHMVETVEPPSMT